MTEDEAKTTRCCGPEGSGRRVYAGHEGADVDGAVIYERMCIGSACMAWRPIMGGSVRNIATGAVREIGMGGIYNVRDEEYTPHPVGGYCGLAGKP